MKAILLALGLIVASAPAGAQAITFGDHTLSLEREHNLTYRSERRPQAVRRTATKPKSKPRSTIAVERRTATAVAGWASPRTMSTPMFMYMAPGLCAFPISVSGGTALSKDGAMEKARETWQRQVEFDLGTSYLSLENAKDSKMLCSSSAVGETVGKYQFSCKFGAIPCRPELEEGE